MKLKNPYTGGYIEYPLYFEPQKLHYQVYHETPFTERYSEWAVSIIETGDIIYIPCGQNRCTDIFIVTKLFMDKVVKRPLGIYTIPMSYFLTPQNCCEYFIEGEYEEDYEQYIDEEDYI